jgi:hypothetical protein
VVIEFSAAWPKWLKPTDCGDMAVVAQHYETLPTSLVTQVASRMTRLEAVGWQVDAVVVVANHRLDPDATASRSILARGLTARLKATGCGALVLTVDERAGVRAANTLRALAHSIHASGRHRPVAISVRVGNTVEILDEEQPTLRVARAG